MYILSLSLYIYIYIYIASGDEEGDGRARAPPWAGRRIGMRRPEANTSYKATD